MKFCLRGLLGDKQRQSFFKLLDVLALLFQDSISADDLSNIDMEVNLVLAMLERDFPISVQVSVSFLNIGHIYDPLMVHIHYYSVYNRYSPVHSVPCE